ncbi:hypothetical protein QFC20_001839 [Naganishia adeliensis]|uniref:Uncharacterized protein n=1 Tax=Naganishia adeliensis TaxID=92952 RepID=A0ACC2WPU6_9TREE|nr:hypothetical protein QFC20_001839 [Naganishia adeliensis]
MSPQGTHKIRVISAFAFFHLYAQEQQLQLATILWSMLEKKEPGNIIFGIQKGMNEPTRRSVPKEKQGQDVFFCHSPTSWKALWTNHIDSSLDVQADLVPSEGKGDNQMRDMIWSVRIV